MLTQHINGKRAHWYKVSGAKKIALYLPGMPKYPQKSDKIKSLMAHDFHVLVPMYQGSFDSEGSFGVEGCVDDVNIWYQYILAGSFVNGIYEKDKVELDLDEIWLVGGSFGGLVGGLAINKYELEQIDRAVILYPLWGMDQFSENIDFVNLAKFQVGLLKYAYPYSYRVRDYDNLFEQFSGQKVVEGMYDKQSYQGKMQIFSARDDEVTPPKMARIMKKQFLGAECCQVNGGHGSKIDWEHVERIIFK